MALPEEIQLISKDLKEVMKKRHFDVFDFRRAVAAGPSLTATRSHPPAHRYRRQVHNP